MLEVMMRDAACDDTLTDLIGRYARQLAAMSDRIYLSEMERLIGIGSARYQQRCGISRPAGSEEGLAAIQDRQDGQ